MTLMKIHQIKTRYSNTYAIEEENGIFLVDVAMRCDGFVLKKLQELTHRSVEDVSLVTCTHDDPDHIGGVLALAKSCRANSAIPYASKRPHLKLYKNPLGPVVKITTTIREAFRERSRKMYLDQDRNERYRHVENQYLNDPVTQRFLPPQRRLKHDAVLPGFSDWLVVHTPGHSWDSVCFYHQKSGSLITGDTLLGSGSIGLVVHPAIFNSPLDRHKTLSRLRQLNLQAIYPGHGSVMKGANLLSHL